MKKMNKTLYVGIYVASLGLAVLAVVLLAFATEIARARSGFRIGIDKKDNAIVWFAVFSLSQLLITHLIYSLVLLVKMWGAINDGCARATPGTAIGYLFIPFYNLYWIFQVWGGFPEDFNEYVSYHKLPPIDLNSTAYKIYPALMALSVIPFFGSILLVISLFVFVRIVSNTCDAVNALAEAAAQPQNFNSIQPAAPVTNFIRTV